MEKLGIDFKLILVQIVNFVLLLFILRKVLYKPVLDMIKRRRVEVDAMEKEKAELGKSRQDLEKREKEILIKAQKEKRELLVSAKRELEAERRKIIEKANSEAKEILQGTKRQIERDKRKVGK